MKQNISYKKRKLADLMRQGLNTTPVIVVSGARQVGKSTLLLNEPCFNKRFLEFHLKGLPTKVVNS